MTDPSIFFDESDEAEFDTLEFSQGRGKRVSLVLLLDTSSSMGHPDLEPPRPIDQLNEALGRWSVEIRRDAALRHTAEIAIITFGNGGVTLLELDAGGPFRPAALFEPPVLEAGGITPMVEAMAQAIALIERRKRELDDAGIPRVRPLVVLLTDGYPTNAVGELDDGWTALASELASLTAANKLLLTAFGTAGANFDVLDALAPGCAIQIGSEDILDALLIMSRSASSGNQIDALKRALDQMVQRRAE